MDLKKIECGPECGFSVTSHDEKEVVGLAMGHVKKMHKMSPSQSEIKSRMKPA